MDQVAYAVFQWVVDNPWVFWVWLGATAVTTALRATFNVTEQRPKWVVFVLALLDVAQLNLSGPMKLIATKAKEPKQ